ncbi:hypothetical protein, partial [Uliginosibacterium flavum]
GAASGREGFAARGRCYEKRPLPALRATLSRKRARGISQVANHKPCAGFVIPDLIRNPVAGRRKSKQPYSGAARQLFFKGMFQALSAWGRNANARPGPGVS